MATSSDTFLGDAYAEASTTSRPNLHWSQGVHTPLSYSKSSTIIIIGPRGTGKSTLAVVAAINLRRKFIDIIAKLENHTDMTVEGYTAKHGVKGYRKTEFQLLQESLTQNPTNCVISCGSQVVEEPSRSYLLQQMKHHPVILVTRSEKEIKENFYGHPDREKILILANLRMSSYRLCSNFEFANQGTTFLDEANYKNRLSFSSAFKGTDSESPTRKEIIATSLKKLESAFLRYLKYIIGDTVSPDYATDPLIHRPWQPVETKPSFFTRTMIMPFYDLTTANIDFDYVAVGIDAITLRIDLMVSWALRKGYDPYFYVAMQITFAWSKTTVPIVFDFSKSFFDYAYLLNMNKDWTTLYNEILYLGLRLNVEYLIVWRELTTILDALVKRKNHTKIISAHTTNTWDRDHLKLLQNQVASDGCDILMVTSYAVSVKDNFDVSANLNFITRDPVPIIAYNTGPLGKTSVALLRVLAPVENPLFYDMSHSFYQLKDGPWTTEFNNKLKTDLMTVEDANTAIYSLFILPKLQYYHFGKFATSRFSSIVHQAAFDFIKLPHLYSDSQSEDISQLQALFQQPNFGGCAISQPFKTRVMDIIDSVSLDARIIGAVNTVKTLRNARTLQPTSLRGENTDWIGTHNCVTKYLSAKNSITANTHVVIIGAGGTARAAIYSLIRLGVTKFHIYNRTRANAAKMIQHFEFMFSNSLMPSLPLENPRPDITFSAVDGLRLYSAPEIVAKRRRDGNDDPIYYTGPPQETQAACASSPSSEATPAKPKLPPSKRQKVSDLLNDKPARRNFGTLSFEQDPKENSLQFKILDSLSEPWNTEIPYPTMILQYTSCASLTVHDSWFNSPTGGIGIDVSYYRLLPLFFFLLTNTFLGHLRTINHALLIPSALSPEQRLGCSRWCGSNDGASVCPF